jgi:hypothetical protein
MARDFSDDTLKEEEEDVLLEQKDFRPRSKWAPVVRYVLVAVVSLVLGLAGGKFVTFGDAGYKGVEGVDGYIRTFHLSFSNPSLHPFSSSNRNCGDTASPLRLNPINTPP